MHVIKNQVKQNTCKMPLGVYLYAIWHVWESIRLINNRWINSWWLISNCSGTDV